MHKSMPFFMLVFLVGFMGCGKTHWGKIWSSVTRMPFLDTDAEIEGLAQKKIIEIFENEGENEFRRLEQSVLHTTMHHRQAIVATGGGTPLFFDNMEWMNANGTTIYLKATPAELLANLEHEKNHRPLLLTSATGTLPATIEKLLAKRTPVYEQARHILQVSTLQAQTLSNLLNINQIHA